MCVYGGDILWVYWCMTFMENISFQNEENVWQWKTILLTSGTQLIYIPNIFPTKTPFWHLHISSKNLPLFVNVCVWGGYIISLLMYDVNEEYQLSKWEDCLTVEPNLAYEWYMFLFFSTKTLFWYLHISSKTNGGRGIY